MTNSNNQIITISGVKNDGKSTLALYYLEKIDKPSLVVDVARQFKANRKYKKIVYGFNELRFFLSNDNYYKAFKKGRLQLIYRPTALDIEKDVDKAIGLIIDRNITDICILFDEMEVYASSRLTRKSNIFKLFYLSRNFNIDVLCVAKVFGLLSNLVKSQCDYFALSQIDEVNSLKYLNERSNKRAELELENIGKHEFLFTDLKKKNGVWLKVKLTKQIIKILEKK